MKDCGYAIRKAYVDKLASQSFSLGVYDTIAPDTVEPPFLIISSQTSIENSDKQSYNFDVTIQFDIVYRTFKSSASPDFKIVTRRMSSNEATFDYVDEAYVFKRVIVFEHFVTQIL